MKKKIGSFVSHFYKLFLFLTHIKCIKLKLDKNMYFLTFIKINISNNYK